MGWKFVIPGLFSEYAAQGQTLLQRYVKRVADPLTGEDTIECPWYAHLLAYQPIQKAMPGEDDSPGRALGDVLYLGASACEVKDDDEEDDLVAAPPVRTDCTFEGPHTLLVKTDENGEEIAIHEVFDDDSEAYKGSFTALAISEEHGIAWACGRAPGEDEWYLFGFELSTLRGDAGTVKATFKEAVDPSLGLKAADRCILFWRPTTERRIDAMHRGHLWVSGRFEQGPRGMARGYEVNREGVPYFALQDCRSLTCQKAMKVGRDVSGIAFFVNTFEDTFVAIARCPDPSRSRKGSALPRCWTEFHSIDYHNDRLFKLDVSQSATQDAAPGASETSKTSLKMAMPVPSGISGLGHDSSLGANPARFFTAAFTGLSAEHYDDSVTKGADPEDRVFVFRQPILQTAFRKSKDQVTLVVLGYDIISAFCIKYGLKTGLCDPPGPNPLVEHLLLKQMKTERYYPLSTTHYPLPTTCYVLFTTYYLLLTIYYSLLTTHCLLLTTHYLLRPTHYLLLTTYYLLLTTYHLLLTACY